MTIIAIKDGFIATDSGAFIHNGAYFSHRLDKIKTVHNEHDNTDYVVTGAGISSAVRRFQEGDFSTPIDPNDNSVVYIVKRQDPEWVHAYHNQGGDLIPSNVNLTDGAMSNYVLGLLDSGMSAPEAVNFCIESGKLRHAIGPVQVFNIEKWLGYDYHKEIEL